MAQKLCGTSRIIIEVKLKLNLKQYKVQTWNWNKTLMEGEVKSVGGIEIEISYWIFSVNPPPQ